MLRRRGLERSCGRGRGDGRRQIVLKDAMKIADAEGAKHENWDANAGSPQDDAFLDIGAREHRRAGLLERGSHLRRAVAVGVRFDDGDDLWNRFVSGTGERVGDGAQVRTNRVKVNASNRGTSQDGVTRLRARDSRSGCVP